jgi:hypothetical protein
MPYCLSRHVSLSFDQAVERVRANSAVQGFGIPTEVMTATGNEALRPLAKSVPEKLAAALAGLMLTFADAPH